MQISSQYHQINAVYYRHNLKLMMYTMNNSFRSIFKFVQTIFNSIAVVSFFQTTINFSIFFSRQTFSQSSVSSSSQFISALTVLKKIRKFNKSMRTISFLLTRVVFRKSLDIFDTKSFSRIDNEDIRHFSCHTFKTFFNHALNASSHHTFRSRNQLMFSNHAFNTSQKFISHFFKKLKSSFNTFLNSTFNFFRSLQSFNIDFDSFHFSTFFFRLSISQIEIDIDIFFEQSNIHSFFKSFYKFFESLSFVHFSSLFIVEHIIFFSQSQISLRNKRDFDITFVIKKRKRFAVNHRSHISNFDENRSRSRIKFSNNSITKIVAKCQNFFFLYFIAKTAIFSHQDQHLIISISQNNKHNDRSS